MIGGSKHPKEDKMTAMLHPKQDKMTATLHPKQDRMAAILHQTTKSKLLKLDLHRLLWALLVVNYSWNMPVPFPAMHQWEQNPALVLHPPVIA
jgi:hypothetical protein